MRKKAAILTQCLFLILLICLHLSCIAPLACWAADKEPSPPRSVTIEDALFLAFQQNPALMQAEEELLKARLNIDKAYTLAMPKLSAKLTASQNLNLYLPDQDWYEFSIGLRQPIYNQGRVSILKKQADTNLSGERNRLLSVKQQILHQTLQAFYLVLQARQIVLITGEAENRLREHLRVTRFRFEVGQVPKNDVLRVEIELSGAEKDLIEAKNNLELAKEGLNRSINLKEPFEVVQPPDLPLMVGDESSLLPAALDQRPDFQSALTVQGVAEEGIRLSKAEFYPRLSLSANYVRGDDSFFPGDGEMQYLGELEVPLFEGGLRFFQIKEARADFRKTQSAVQALKRDIRLQVTQAYRNLQKISDSIKATENQAALAEENLRLVTFQYEEGLALNLDVIDANVSLVKAMTDFASLRYEQTLAYFDLQFALGRLTVDEVKKLLKTRGRGTEE